MYLVPIRANLLFFMSNALHVSLGNDKMRVPSYYSDKLDIMAVSLGNKHAYYNHDNVWIERNDKLPGTIVRAHILFE